MAFATCEDEGGVDAALDVGAEGRFYVGGVAVACDLLKLVDGHKAGLVCLAKILEDFVQCDGRVFDVSKSKAPCRDAVDVQCDFGTYGA